MATANVPHDVAQVNGSLDPVQANGSLDPAQPNESHNAVQNNESHSAVQANGSQDPVQPNGSHDTVQENGTHDPEQASAPTTPLAAYLFTRLHQLKCESIHGVPGDYTLTLCDYISEEPQCSLTPPLTWVGNCNELNAAYACDGYSRIAGLAAMVVTSGVGELSAINGIAACYAEYQPVVLIAGTPTTMAQEARLWLHHTLGGGDFRVFAETFSRFSVVQLNLGDYKARPAEVSQAIDAMLRECIMQSRPVYLEVPTDVVELEVPSKPLQTPIDLTPPTGDVDANDAASTYIFNRLQLSQRPFLMIDGLIARYGLSELANRLVRVTEIPTSTAPYGKSIIDETLPSFYGTYHGLLAADNFRAEVEASDMILRLGSFDTDVNTLGFSAIPDAKLRVDCHRYMITASDTSFENINLKTVLSSVLDKLEKSKLSFQRISQITHPTETLKDIPREITDSSSIIDHARFWPYLCAHFFRPRDIILADPGTSGLATRDFVLPPETTLVCSALWLSIGTSLPAALGCGLAQRERKLGGRVVLLQGDGSFQMTVQELSTIIRNKVDVIILLINNSGYSIERLIHGMDAQYNEVSQWRYHEIPMLLGGAPVKTDETTNGTTNGATDSPPNLHEKESEYEVRTHKVDKWPQLCQLLQDEKFSSGRGLNFVEIKMAPEDCPELMKKSTSMTAKRNAQK